MLCAGSCICEYLMHELTVDHPLQPRLLFTFPQAACPHLACTGLALLQQVQIDVGGMLSACMEPSCAGNAWSADQATVCVACLSQFIACWSFLSV